MPNEPISPVQTHEPRKQGVKEPNCLKFANEPIIQENQTGRVPLRVKRNANSTHIDPKTPELASAGLLGCSKWRVG